MGGGRLGISGDNMQYTEKEISQIVLEIAQKIYLNEIDCLKGEGHWIEEFQIRHAEYAIECARNFVQVATEKGVINALQLPLEFRP